MRVLVTGARGFIGSAIARSLAHSAYSVIGVGIGPEPDGFVGAWLNCAVHEIPEDALIGCDAIVHCAWRGIPGLIDAFRSEFDRNINSSVDLYLRAASCGVGQYIFLSSGGTVYGDGYAAPISERDPSKPTNWYGTSKTVTELWLSQLAKSTECRLTIARIANVYGPGQLPWRGQGLIATAIACAMTSTPFQLWGDGLVVRDYIYIDDLVSAIHSLFSGGAVEGVFNVGTGVGSTILQCIEHVDNASDVAVDVCLHPARGVDVRYNVLDISKLNKTFGWAPTFDLVDGIRNSHQWMLANPEKWMSLRPSAT